MTWSQNKKRVQFFNEAIGKLEKNHQAKALEFIKNGCIVKISDDKYICKPIIGYNKTTHHMDFLVAQGKYICSCQGFRTNSRCSHLSALKGTFAMEKRKWPDEEQMSLF